MTAIRDAKDGNGGYASVNGLDTSDYEVHGAGDPLVGHPRRPDDRRDDGAARLGPGPVPARRRAEPQAHGHTADADRPLTYEQLADDAAALIAHLGLGRADVLGFSVGGGGALQTAIRHPEAVRKLVVVSGTFRGDGEFPEIRAFEAAFAPDLPPLAPIREANLAASSDPDRWASLVAKMRDLLAEEYDWSAQVKAIAAPTLVVVGDADTLPVAHARSSCSGCSAGTRRPARWATSPRRSSPSCRGRRTSASSGTPTCRRSSPASSMPRRRKPATATSIPSRFATAACQHVPSVFRRAVARGIPTSCSDVMTRCDSSRVQSRTKPRSSFASRCR